MTPDDLLTADLYKTLLEYRDGTHHNISLFASCMYRLMRGKVWESGWYNELRGRNLTAPSLSEFITRPIPEGLHTDVAWVAGALKLSKDLNVRCGDQAYQMFNDYMKIETGKSADEILSEAIADSDDFAHSFRFYFAHHSRINSPG